MEWSYTAQQHGRLSVLLKEEMRLSSGLMNRLKWQDRLLVNGIPRYTDYPVVPGDTITVCLEPEKAAYPAQDGPLTVLYEDAYLLAVEKPAGMLIHPSRCCNTGTLANYVQGYYGQTGQQCALHPITRLDRDTFGVVLLAKNAHLHALLQMQPIRKTYHAMVFGKMPAPSGMIDAPIARKPLPSLLREVREDGKPSRTHYRVMEQRAECQKVELQPLTGRTHQLRVHCAYVGAPILGDPQYGTAESTKFSGERALRSQQLCAKEIEFQHPVTAESLQITAMADVKI